MKVHVEFDRDAVTLDEMIEVQEGNLRRTKEIFARFARDEEGEPIDQEEAEAMIGGMTLAELTSLMEGLVDAANPPK